jgi:hypothetical protein
MTKVKMLGIAGFALALSFGAAAGLSAPANASAYDAETNTVLADGDGFTGTSGFDFVSDDTKESVIIKGSLSEIRGTLVAIYEYIHGAGQGYDAFKTAMQEIEVLTLNFTDAGELGLTDEDIAYINFILRYVNDVARYADGGPEVYEGVTVNIQGTTVDVTDLTMSAAEAGFKLGAVDAAAIIANDAGQLEALGIVAPEGYEYAPDTEEPGKFVKTEIETDNGESGGDDGDISDGSDDTDGGDESGVTAEPGISGEAPKTASGQTVQAFGAAGALEKLAALAERNPGNAKFQAAWEKLAAVADNEIVFIQLENGADCKGADCAVTVPLEGLKPLARYYVYHVDDDGALTLIGQFDAKADGTGAAEIEDFSGNIVTTVQLTDAELAAAPQSGVIGAAEESADASWGVAAGITTLAGAGAVSGRKLSRRRK